MSKSGIKVRFAGPNFTIMRQRGDSKWSTYITFHYHPIHSCVFSIAMTFILRVFT